MPLLLSVFAKSFGRMRRRMRTNATAGSAAIEFAMVAPVLFLFLFGIIETSVIFFASSMLENATDDTARQIRTGQLSGALTASQIRTSVCAEVNGLIGDCSTALQIDMRVYNTFAASSYPSVTKADGSVDPNQLQIQSAADCNIVLLRTFYPWTVMTPLMTPLLQSGSSGKVLLTSSAAFRTEPYASSSTC